MPGWVQKEIVWPLTSSVPPMPIDVGIVRTVLPLLVTVTCLVVSSATAICESPMVNAVVASSCPNSPPPSGTPKDRSPDRDLGAGGIVRTRSPVNILVIHPVPRAFERHRRLHSQAFLRRCTIEDRLVEMRDNNDPYPESATICEEVTPGRHEGWFGQVPRLDCGEGAGLIET